MPEQGDIIDQYELVRRLGGGAFGEVWRVRHLDLDHARAMKIPTDPDYVRQLRQEGRIQFSLAHPNIVQTLDLNTRHDPPFFVMELVEGEDLRKRLAARGKLTVPETLGIVCQILEALNAAHSRGVLHRDLKPENVLITPDATAKVTDFGLGRVQAEVAQSLYVSGSMVSESGKSIAGTFDYMSPEQRRGGPASPGDDLYAVGILTCELVTGRRPSAAGVARTLERAGIARELAVVLEKACEEADYRYASAAEMLADLEALRARVGEADQRAPSPAKAPTPPPKRVPSPAPEPPSDIPELEAVTRPAPPSPPPELEPIATNVPEAIPVLEETSGTFPESGEQPEAELPPPSAAASLLGCLWTLGLLGAVAALGYYAPEFIRDEWRAADDRCLAMALVLAPVATLLFGRLTGRPGLAALVGLWLQGACAYQLLLAYRMLDREPKRWLAVHWAVVAFAAVHALLTLALGVVAAGVLRASRRAAPWAGQGDGAGHARPSAMFAELKAFVVLAMLAALAVALVAHNLAPRAVAYYMAGPGEGLPAYGIWALIGAPLAFIALGTATRWRMFTACVGLAAQAIVFLRCRAEGVFHPAELRLSGERPVGLVAATQLFVAIALLTALAGAMAAAWSAERRRLARLDRA